MQEKERMTREMAKKISSIMAKAEKGDRGEKWVDKDGTIVEINRCPIDWERVIKATKERKNG